MFKDIPKKWWFKWLVVGVLIRLVLMPITVHPDLWGHSFAAYFLAYEGKLNVYEHLLSLGSNHPLVKNFGVADIFIYPPLTYYTLGLFRFLVRPFTDPNFIPWLMSNLGQINSYPGLYRHLFFFKLPYLFIDIALAFVLSQLFQDQKKKVLAFVLWMLNPLTLYTTFMIGQLDILPAFFTVLSLYFATNKKPTWSLLCLGIGGSFKMYPLFLVPPAAFFLAKKTSTKLKNLFIGILPYLITIFPFLGSSAFRSMVLFSPKSQKMLFMIFNLSSAEGVYPFVFGLFFIYFLSWYRGRKFKLQTYFLAILLLIFSTTHYHPQWFLWVAPFITIELVENNFKHLLINLTLVACWLLITLFFEPSLSIGLFNPIAPHANEIAGLTDLISPYLDVFQVKSIIRSIFAAASLFLVYDLFRLDPQKNNV